MANLIAWPDMDDRTSTDFHKTLPLGLPAPSFKAVPKKRRRFGTLLLLIVAPTFRKKREEAFAEAEA